MRIVFHQVEEYRMVGTFPGMINRVMFKSDQPDRFPLNTHTAFVINVWVGWVSYGLAALLGIHAIWLGIATMLVSLGNIIAHMFVFNIKGKTWFNAGMATSLLLFVPCVYGFYKIVVLGHLACWMIICLGSRWGFC